jgi:predicted ATP-grasp superfamily ATP-dependent carboligase
VEWLLDFGARKPGHVLSLTSDDLAWLYARHRDELSKHYLFSSPSLAVTHLLLNKVRLQLAARAVGLAMPRTWLPDGETGFDEIVREARFPLVIKPQSQVLLRPHAKGVIVSKPGDLRRQYAEFAGAVRYAPTVLAHDPRLSRPSVQEYSREAAENVYGISGFIDETGELFAARASRKLLQHPQELGVGLCFEGAHMEPELEAKLVALCKRVGYHGVFEAEFIERDGAFLLIDFNPRFYGQMAFDVARGLPLPLFAYQAAIGDRERLREEIERARAADPRQIRAYCRSFELKVFLTLRRMCGKTSRDSARRWRAWLEEHRRTMVDSVFDAEDRSPSSVEAIHHLAGYARHPRAFLRQVFRG